MSFARNLFNKYEKQLLDTATQIRLDALKTASKKVVHKEAEATDEFLEHQITDKIMKSKSVIDEDSRRRTYVEELIIPRTEKEEILNKLRQVLLK